MAEAAKPTLDIEEAKRRASAGPRLLLARRAVLLALTFVSTVTVARLVSPREYGLAAMSTVIFSFAQIFRDFGLTNAVLRKGTIDQAELTTIFWCNVAMTTALSVLLALLAPAVSAFYGEPVVLWTMLASLVGFQIGGIALQHRALINRDLRFSAIAVIDIAAQLGGFAVSLSLALWRHDVWALVFGTITQSLIAAGLSVALSGWMPGRPARSEGLRDLIAFGANSSVYSISVFLSNNAAQLIVGHTLGSALLGQYNRAQTLFQLPNANLIQPITQSVMPLLTRLRVDPPEYRAAYLGLVRRLCVFLMPISMTLVLIAVPLTQVLLGDRWKAAGEIFAALAPALAAMGLGYATGDVFVTQNRSAELRNLGLIELAIRVSAVAGGAFLGVVQTAIAFTLSTIVVVLIRVCVAGREGPLTTRDQLGAARVGLPPALGALAVAGACKILASGLPNIAQVVLLGAAGAAGGALAGCMFASSRRAMVELAQIFGIDRLPARLRRRRAGSR